MCAVLGECEAIWSPIYINILQTMVLLSTFAHRLHSRSSTLSRPSVQQTKTPSKIQSRRLNSQYNLIWKRPLGS